MAVGVDVYENILELYPETRAALKDFALLKREIILHYMETSLKLDGRYKKSGDSATRKPKVEQRIDAERQRPEMPVTNPKNDEQMVEIPEESDGSSNLSMDSAARQRDEAIDQAASKFGNDNDKESED